jgi:dTDP-4-dehydrorhamnose 3,5-epimerase
MKFEALGIHQACLVRVQPRADNRGFFARTYCAQEFAAAGLPPQIVQASVSFSLRRGTLRGMHFQWPPSREGKLVRCLRGAVFDVLLDLRPRSPTYLQHVSVHLDEEDRDSVFVPHGVAHGFQTLADATEVLYQMTDLYTPDLATGVRWNDRSFGIEWPEGGPIVISDRDAQYGDFDRMAFESELASRSGAGE